MSDFNSTSAPRGYSAVPARFNSTSAPCVPAGSWRCANGHLHQAWPPDPPPAQPADPPTKEQARWGCPRCGSSLSDTGELCEHQRGVLAAGLGPSPAVLPEKEQQR